ncbi:hypothetical protein AB0H63_10865 [Micromonospora echinospora]|uniref:hypothetical protein n=1 Tax=Micromonospora echinospora TaxID=1877 RepID=UPI0033CC2F93
MPIRPFAPPDRLLAGMHGETDHRGFLVTHVVFRDEAGAPVLKLADTDKAVRCMLERRCQTCGLDIAPDDQIVFVGYSADATFKEPPLHLDCADYSLGVCPALITRHRHDQLLVVVCRDYEFLPGSEGRSPRCRPLPAIDEHGREVPPVEYTVEELHRMLTERASGRHD